MPYTYLIQTKEGRKKYCMTNKSTGKTYCYDSPEAREKGAKMHEAFAHGFKPTRKKETANGWLKKKMKKDSWKKGVDNKMRSFGDIDYGKKKIRINPKKGDVIDSILHEEAHKKFPNKTEKQIKRIALKKNKEMSLRQKVAKLKEYI